MHFATKALQAKIENAPLESGCYIYKDKINRIIYIGKAKVLRNRVKSYFQLEQIRDPKILQLHNHIVDVEFVTTDNDLEAFLLETNLIKKYQPKYNKQKKDDKNYSWLYVDTDEDFPRYEFVREKYKNKKGVYFGPFILNGPIRRILKNLRPVFPYRTCNRKIQLQIDKKTGKKFVYSSDYKPCLYFQLGLCNAPCNGKLDKTSYKRNIHAINKFFLKGKNEVFTDLQKKMQLASSKQNYEQAAILRNKIRDLENIVEKTKIDYDTDEFTYKTDKQQLLLDTTKNIYQKISENEISKSKNIRFECYDISNISGTNAVASMVVFVDGKPENKSYRKFKIRSKNTPDDFAMIRETLTRRFSTKNLNDKKFAARPDLIIIDGGKGQLSSALKVLDQLKINIPIAGLAKRDEELFIPRPSLELTKEQPYIFIKKTLDRGSNERFLIQRLRDETHRFAITYHRTLRSKSQIHSVLDKIPGIGVTTKKNLLKAFGSVENIRKAKDSELAAIIRNRKTRYSLMKMLESAIN